MYLIGSRRHAIYNNTELLTINDSKKTRDSTLIMIKFSFQLSHNHQIKLFDRNQVLSCKTLSWYFYLTLTLNFIFKVFWIPYVLIKCSIIVPLLRTSCDFLTHKPLWILLWQKLTCSQKLSLSGIENGVCVCVCESERDWEREGFFYCNVRILRTGHKLYFGPQLPETTCLARVSDLFARPSTTKIGRLQI